MKIYIVKGISDREFVFRMKVLKEYVEKMHIDVIAITNHDLFDYINYMAIQREVEGGWENGVGKEARSRRCRNIRNREYQRGNRRAQEKDTVDEYFKG